MCVVIAIWLLIVGIVFVGLAFGSIALNGLKTPLDKSEKVAVYIFAFIAVVSLWLSAYLAATL